MFRILILLLALTLCPLYGYAEDLLTFTEDLSGVYTWPENVSEAEAAYVYRYTYPQVAGDSERELSINEYFRVEADEALGFECPIIGSGHDPSLGQMLVDICYEISRLSSDCLSVRTVKTITVGEQVSRIVKGFTFTLTGPLAGSVTSLPYLLDVIEDGETDEWLIDRQTAKVDNCVRDLVWFMIEREMKQDNSLIFDDMTFEEFIESFYPEQDFYINKDGHCVFFIQENTIAPAEAGTFYYTLTVDELLDEL